MSNITEDFFYNANVTELAAGLADIDPECFGDYGMIVLACCLLVSEMLPFYKKFCAPKAEVGIDQEITPPKGNILQESDGILQMVIVAAEKFKKK